jgi:hypothetical protein
MIKETRLDLVICYNVRRVITPLQKETNTLLFSTIHTPLTNIRKNIMIILHTNHGEIHIELDEKNAPKTSENFLNYVKEGFYDNTIFHRVIDNFMIQGGGFDANMNQKKTKALFLSSKNNQPASFYCDHVIICAIKNHPIS